MKTTKSKKADNTDNTNNIGILSRHVNSFMFTAKYSAGSGWGSETRREYGVDDSIVLRQK